MNASSKTVERLILYRILLRHFQQDIGKRIFSHQLAKLAGVTPAQVRRDLMTVGYMGSPVRGYDLDKLLESIGGKIDPKEKHEVALVGIGHIGRAILAYFNGRSGLLEITAAFDTDPSKVNRVIQGCRCYPMDELAGVLRSQKIITGIITVPADAAQSVAEKLIESGAHGLLNYAPVRLRVPEDVYVEDRDMALSVEKVAYFSREIVGRGNS
jgi:redox-sensing transcriptional repressor